MATVSLPKVGTGCVDRDNITDAHSLDDHDDASNDVARFMSPIL